MARIRLSRSAAAAAEALAGRFSISDGVLTISAHIVEPPEPEPEPEPEPIDYASMTVSELKALAGTRGLDVPSRIRKADLIALIEASD
jgi:hypothetical protein